MSLQQTRALVLAVRSHGEADKIVTLYSRESGKLSGIAKGAQRSRIRFVNKLELFSLLEVTYEEGRTSSLVRIDQAELIQPFAAIRRDYDRYAAACLVGELLREWTREADADPRIFQLAVWALQAIDQTLGQTLGQSLGQSPARNPGHSLCESGPELLLVPVIFFELKLLDLLGYRPNLEGCLRCGDTSPAERTYHFSLAAGGLLCPNCNRGSRHSLIPISLATAKFLSKAQELATDKLTRLRPPSASGQEALNFLHHFSRHLLQREIHSRACFLP